MNIFDCVNDWGHLAGNTQKADRVAEEDRVPWKWDGKGNLVAEKGDQSYSLAKFLGTTQKEAMTILNRGGVTANDKRILNLKEGQAFSKDDLWVGFESESGPIVNNTKEALEHYFNGKGEPVDIGNLSTKELLNSMKFQSKHSKITSENVRPNGYFSVDMTDLTFHIGNTGVDYSISSNGKSSSVTYTLFTNTDKNSSNFSDGFWDADFIDENTLGKIPLIKDWTNTKSDELGPNLERFGGTPYSYKTKKGVFFFGVIEEGK